MTSYKFNSTYSLLSNREQFIVLTSATEKDRLVKILSPFSFFKYKRHFSVRGSLYFLTLKHFSTSYTCHPHSKTQSIPVQILFLNNHPSRRIFDSENNKKKTNKFETLSHPFTHALSLSTDRCSSCCTRSDTPLATVHDLVMATDSIVSTQAMCCQFHSVILIVHNHLNFRD